MSKARTFAIAAHGGQEYGTGRPYAVHLDAVAKLVAPFGETAITLAYLHDVVEDTDKTLEQVQSAFWCIILRFYLSLNNRKVDPMQSMPYS